MSRYRVAVVATVDGWYACAESRAHPLRGYPIGLVSDAVACSILLGVVLCRAGLSQVAAKLNVPVLPAGIA